MKTQGTTELLTNGFKSNLEEIIAQQQAEIDMLRRRIKVLEAGRNTCAQTKELHPECRTWLVMNDMLKSKHRVRRDGR